MFVLLSASIFYAQDYEQAFYDVQQSFEQRSEIALDELNEYTLCGRSLYNARCTIW